MDDTVLAGILLSIQASVEALVKQVKPKPQKLQKGYKRCRCKKPIPKDWPTCGACRLWENRDWIEGGPAHRRMMHAVIKQVNA